MCNCPSFVLHLAPWALKLGLLMGANSFMLLGAFLELPQFLRFSAEDVWCMMDPMRSSTLPCSREDPSTGSLIQANQGHSLKVTELELIPLRIPQALFLMLIHSTFW